MIMEDFLAPREFEKALRAIVNKIDSLEKSLIQKLPIKKGYTITEFSEHTGLDASTIVNYCNDGLIKAFQVKKNGSWTILASELDRMINEAEQNHHSNPQRTGKRDYIILQKQSALKNRKP